MCRGQSQVAWGRWAGARWGRLRAATVSTSLGFSNLSAFPTSVIFQGPPHIYRGRKDERWHRAETEKFMEGGRERENVSGREKQGETETGLERDREPGQEGQDRKDTKRQEQPTVGCGVKIKKLPRERRLGTEKGEGGSNGQRKKQDGGRSGKEGRKVRGKRPSEEGMEGRLWLGSSGPSQAPLYLFLAKFNRQS